MKAILVNGSPRLEGSIGKKISEKILDDFLSKKYEIEDITHIDLYATDLADFSQPYMENFYSEDKPKTEGDILQENVRDCLYQHFVNAEIVVISIPKYNFSYPTTVKAYIDTLYNYKKSYDPDLPEGKKGLLEPKKELIVVTTAGDANTSLDTGLEKSIFEAFEYLNLDSTLTIIPVANVHELSDENLNELLNKTLIK